MTTASEPVIPTALKVAGIALVIAFAPVTAAEHGFDPLPHWIVAWCMIIGYPVALIAMIGSMGNADDR